MVVIDINLRMRYKMKQSNQLQFVNLSSVCSALAVVYLHANSCFWNFSTTARYWKTANFIGCFFYFAVPVFFMISGATLIDYNKRYDIKTYFKKRINKTLIPYLVWSFFALFFRYYYLHSLVKSDFNLRFIVNELLTGSSCEVYWFFIPLFCLYLAIPFISEVPAFKRKKLFIYVIFIQFIFGILFSFFNVTFNLQLQFDFISVSNSYLIFLFLGYLLVHYEIQPTKRYIVYFLGVIGLCLHLFGTYYTSIQAGKIIRTFTGYYNLPGFLWSISIFVFFKYAGQKIMQNRIINKIINKIKNYTFSLYLLHWYILQILLKEFSINETSIIYRMTAPFIALGITIIVTKLIRKIPIINKILP